MRVVIKELVKIIGHNRYLTAPGYGRVPSAKSPLPTAGNIHVAGDYFFAIDEVLNVIEDEHVDHVIVGLPLQMDGTEGKSAKKARRWAANLEKRLQAESEDSDSTEYQIDRKSVV